MSKEAFVRFRDMVMRDAKLQAEIVDTVKSQTDLLAMGRRLGYEFDAADIQSSELTEEELAHVTGGGMLLAGGAGIVYDKDHKSWSPVGTYWKWLSPGALGSFPKIS